MARRLSIRSSTTASLAARARLAAGQTAVSSLPRQPTSGRTCSQLSPTPMRACTRRARSTSAGS